MTAVLSHRIGCAEVTLHPAQTEEGVIQYAFVFLQAEDENTTLVLHTDEARQLRDVLNAVLPVDANEV